VSSVTKKDETQFKEITMKKLLLAIVLSLPLMTAAASVSIQKQIPIPECFPCDEGEAPPLR
jgi:hypothetical protein